jgi:hypothetical protein
LVAASVLFQGLVLSLFPKLLPLVVFCLLSSAVLISHWWRYQPSGYFSPDKVVFEGQDEPLECTWSNYSRVALGCCLVVVFEQDVPKCKLIFADSLPEHVYRKLCFVINFPKAEVRL